MSGQSDRIVISSNKEETEENKRVKSYAEKLKTKNTLVIKSNDGDKKATQKKKAIISKITTQVDEVKEGWTSNCKICKQREVRKCQERI